MTLSLKDFSIYAYRLLGRNPLTRDLAGRLGWLHRYLEVIDFPFPMEYYVALSLLVFMVTLFSGFSLIFFYYYLHRFPLFFLFPLSLTLSLALAIFGFGMVIFLPVLKVAEIKSRMESGALFAIITLTAVVSSGLNLFDSISFSENMISTKEIRNSFRRIVERVNTGIDLRDSLLLESELVPSKTFSMLYEGLSSISMSGVGLSDFLEGFLWDLLNAMEGKVRSAIDRLGVLVESYIIVAVIFPFMLVLIMLMAGGSWGLLGGVSQTLLLFDVGLLPPVFAILILLADMILREVMLD